LNNFVLLGKIISIYGKSGEVKVKVFDTDVGQILPFDFCFVDFFGSKKKLNVASFKRTGDNLIVLFDQFNSPDASAILLNKELYLLREETNAEQEFSYLIKDLLQSTVIAKDELLGTIKDVLSLPGNDVYVVEDTLGNEILVPAIKQIIGRFDKKKKLLHLKVNKTFFEDDEN